MFQRGFKITLTLLFLLIVGTGGERPVGINERVRAHTRAAEFDFVDWTLDAVALKLRQSAFRPEDYLIEDAQRELVLGYIDLVGQMQITEAEISRLLAHPDQVEVAEQLADTQQRLDDLIEQTDQLAPLAENILQSQLAKVASEYDLTLGGQPLPPVLYRSTPLPWALIVSPRDTIQQAANISLATELSMEERIAIEEVAAVDLDVSTLVVPVGGVGTYPSMVAQSSNLNWLTEVIYHEWIHNYLNIRPLGLLYNRSQDLRTMNETAANIAGKELGAALIARFYPSLVPPAPQPAPSTPEDEAQAPKSEPDEPVFDFRAEMHTTRIEVDRLLAAGQIEAAEDYMEARRLFFWENGYPIRKLNQAYFAFYGSYADSPSGAAGEDPVGAAVRDLWARSSSLKEFLDRMAFLTSFQDLEDLLVELD